jgi:uncharacterized RDD family membrane protein YckC
MNELVYHDPEGRAYTVRDGVSVWLEELAAPASRLEYVGFWRRGFAVMIDLVITALIAIATGALLGILVVLLAPSTGWDVAELLGRFGQTRPSGFLLSLVAAFAYDVFGQAIHGSTPGKMVLGITVRSEDGGYCGWAQAMKRSLLFYVDSLFFGLVGYKSMQSSPTEQRFGDRWAKSVVVRTRSIDPTQRRSVIRFIGASAAACLAYASLSLLSAML